MKKYKAAIIGCGRIGSEFDKKPVRKIAFSHAGAYSICPRTALVTACDLRRSKREEFKKKWGVDTVYSDYKKMLKNEGIDILSVCTPANTHSAIVRYAARFSLKAIYCEKPISDNLKDAERTVKLCKDKGILLMVNHQRRFSPFYRELKSKISSGHFGRIQHVNCYYTRGIYNTGIHIIDLFIFLFGRVQWVQAYHSSNKSPFKNDPNLDGVIMFKNGLQAAINACDDAHYLILEIDILAAKARIRLGTDIGYFKLLKGRNLLGKKELVRAKSSHFKSKYGMISLSHGVEHIIDCLEKKQKPLSPGSQAAYALEVIEKLCYSAKSMKRVTLNKRV